MFTQYIKATKITNVNLVANHFLMQATWRNTSTQFMKATKITNVNLVANHSPELTLWRNICTQFMKATNITNVNIVANHSLELTLWRNIYKLFTKSKKYYSTKNANETSDSSSCDLFIKIVKISVIENQYVSDHDYWENIPEFKNRKEMQQSCYDKCHIIIKWSCEFNN